MSYFFLIPVSIILGLTGLGAFFWAIKNNQYDDLQGAATRILNGESGPVVPDPTRQKTDRLPADHPATEGKVD